MRGHEKIIAARLQGQAPSFVFVNDYPCKTDWFELADYATVCTHGKPVTGLDLRFLTGLRVSISATTEERAKALFERVKDAGASTVAACHIQASKHASNQAGWASVWRKEAVNG